MDKKHTTDISGNLIEFNKTTFYRGVNSTYGKIPVRLELFFSIDTLGPCELRLGLFIGMDKMYRVSDIDRFVEAVEGQENYHFSKNFIFEPTKMYFEKSDMRVLNSLRNLKLRSWNNRETNNKTPIDLEAVRLNTNEVVLDQAGIGMFLDFIWEDIGRLDFCKQSTKYHFKEDVDLDICILKDDIASYSLDKDIIYDPKAEAVELKKEATKNLIVKLDYSKYGDFEPLTVDFKYIIFKDTGVVGKLSEEKRDIFINIYNFKNNENIVFFKVGVNDRILFKKNFLDRYSNKLNITFDADIKKELEQNTIVARVYFDVAAKGIVSKIEYCYGENTINPLDDVVADVRLRDFDIENRVIEELKAYGFIEYRKLFLLNDAEKIIVLLTDKLAGLKKISEVYYSQDFKKLYVKSISKLGLQLSEDGSVIHMNINLENISDEELIELLDAMKELKKYYRLRNGSIVDLSSVESGKFIDLINSLDIDRNGIKNGIINIPANKAFYIDNYLKENNINNVDIDLGLGNLIKDITGTKEIEVELDDSLNGLLRNYQVVGVKWLKTMAKYTLGGILADDMGLGKTLQVLAFIASEKERKKPCIVVAPTSLIYNWKAEAEKFVPQLKVMVITGAKDVRSWMICGCMEYDLVITSYGALRNDVEDYKKVSFLYAFVDEAQNIKNSLTLNASSVKSISAKCCFALTGTPIENRLSELWSIFDFIMPGYLFDNNKFTKKYEEPIARWQDAQRLNELSKMVKPFIIRRLKRDVLSELPEKIETNYIAELTQHQKKLYAAYYKSLKEGLLKKIEEEGIAGKQIEIFSALTRLRQICAHPGTFLEDYDGGSGKLEVAMDIITQSISLGHSILLFSQFTKMLKIIRKELDNSGINYYYLDGSMKPEERMMEIDNFNADTEAVFLISLKAGGTGLNLTKADIIIHFDPWWNPAVENQASDRAHRLGQKNVVQVYKLLTEGTIEEKILQLQDKKRELIDSVIEPGTTFLDRLSGDEIKDLFKL